MHVLLSGIVGSTAYGLAHEGSDIDRLGVYALPTVDLFGLNQPDESKVTTSPDKTLHEARKWCRLAIGGNPTASELVWLADDLYEVRNELGNELIDLRTAFLSEKPVRNAYLGYATQQFRKLQARGDGTFSSDVRNRSEKHARHLLRLLDQGTGLHRTGKLTLRVEDPDGLRAEAIALVNDPERCIARLAAAEDIFNGPGVLPQEPNTAAVLGWLRRVRRAHWVDDGTVADRFFPHRS